MPLTTVAPFADVKALLSWTGANYAAYPAAQAIDATLIASFDNYLGRYLATGTYTETLYRRSRATSFVMLRALPIASVTTVTVDGDATTDFTIDAWGLRLGSSALNLPIVVTYVGGYDDATLPSAIRRAGALQLIYEYNRLPHVGATSVTADGGTVRTPELGLLAEVKRLLAPYRHPSKLL